MGYMVLPLKRYADFTGRSRRMEFWMFALFQFLAVVGLAVLGALLTDPGSDPDAAPSFLVLLAGLFWLGMLIPGLAVTVRRLHDRNISGWFYLIVFVPFGALILFVMMLLPGTEGENEYGPDPLDEDPNFPDQLERVFT